MTRYSTEIFLHTSSSVQAYNRETVESSIQVEGYAPALDRAFYISLYKYNLWLCFLNYKQGSEWVPSSKSPLREAYQSESQVTKFLTAIPGSLNLNTASISNLRRPIHLVHMFTRHLKSALLISVILQHVSATSSLSGFRSGLQPSQVWRQSQTFRGPESIGSANSRREASGNVSYSLPKTPWTNSSSFR